MIRELSASIILFTPTTKVISVVIFDLKEEGQFGAIAVLGLVMLVMTFATVALVQRALGRDFLRTRERRRLARRPEAYWRARTLERSSLRWMALMISPAGTVGSVYVGRVRPTAR